MSDRVNAQVRGSQGGRVTLVGAGPGGADLITVRGARALAEADVVVFDRLADPELLDLAPRTAERICVGKSKGEGVDQESINALLVERAARGCHVVRLKGGDPFVFGRGSEERDAVESAGLRCEVVPGLSSALAAPALAGIPLTHRGVSASFTVLTGHRITESDHDWSALARSGSTLVVLMGASTGADVARCLLAEGRRPDEPVAAVHRAGTPDVATATLTLDQLAIDGCPFVSPTVIVIGLVAAFAAAPDRVTDRTTDRTTEGVTDRMVAGVTASVTDRATDRMVAGVTAVERNDVRADAVGALSVAEYATTLSG